MIKECTKLYKCMQIYAKVFINFKMYVNCKRLFHPHDMYETNANIFNKQASKTLVVFKYVYILKYANARKSIQIGLNIFTSLYNYKLCIGTVCKSCQTHNNCDKECKGMQK